MRTFDVLVERTTQGWVTVEAEDQADARRLILRKNLIVPEQDETRWARSVLAREPITHHGRVLVLSARRTFGVDPMFLLDLDCGHHAYIDLDTWFPDNPYYECNACANRLRRAS